MFIRWLGCLFLGIFGFTALVSAAIGASIGRLGVLPVIVLAVILVFVLGSVIAGGVSRMTRPMDGLIEAAGRIESGDYSTRVPEWGPRELRSVSRAFNAMSARLQTIDEQRKSFLADVTHELRTPLSVIRGQAEAIADGLYPPDAAHLAPILDATDTLDRLVEDLRTMVLADAGNLALHKEAVEVGDLLRETVDAFRAQAESAGVVLLAELPDQLPTMDLDPTRIRSAIGNLISNAIRHTPSGGSVKVVGSATPAAVVIVVSDTGEGIPADLLPHVFERFVKGPGSSGSGLGLAIAHDIVAAHGGTLTIESAVGHGTTVRATLPARSSGSH